MGDLFLNYTPPARYIPKITKHEESLQKSICRYLRKYYPYVEFHSDYAAGLKLTKNQATIRKSLQSGRGWSDMFIPYPMTHKRPDGTEVTYHGLFLELKKAGTTIYVSRGANKGQLSADEQIRIEAAFLDRMNSLGYFARFGVGYDHTTRLIDWYFQKPQNSELF